MDFIPNTDSDRREMLEDIGVNSLRELFSDIPDDLKVEQDLVDGQGETELELKESVKAIADRNEKPGDRLSLLGAGLYDHFIPSIVSHVTGRSEFYSAYTPYQAEISQGTLTWMFEFQTEISELTGMDIANSSMYDGGSAAAEAVLMAQEYLGKDKVIVSETLNPRYRDVIETYLPLEENQVIELGTRDGRIDRINLEEILASEDSIAGLVVQSPNYMGIVEDLSGLKEELKDSFLIVSSNPISLGLLEPPGNFGADIVVGEGQPLGNPMNFGGPLLGLFATRKDYLRYLPGRVSGKTVDREGNGGYVMALQTREQHIKRERATSNICTNQALNALAATVYLASLGPSGLKSLAKINWDKAHYLADELTDLPGIELAWNQPFFNEFAIKVPGDPCDIWEKMKQNGVDLLHPDTLKEAGWEDLLLVAVTEKVKKDELDHFVDLMRGEVE
ncbi:MAG: aminomethyl-transferring glycine dehydrogenase subunit GcvPA [Candidatus Bipolaricaulota bacterium]|nr:aminomethyl-transferring glycine dehydrogenase subunit GcvPA [Candidatus Bipolaricaulota bacterium]MBS3791140.1 aminomethyl-transferring glycine dehydrogenase subunit GcvPA [Candidatus Bipolaricaulota bacterium]